MLQLGARGMAALMRPGLAGRLEVAGTLPLQQRLKSDQATREAILGFTNPKDIRPRDPWDLGPRPQGSRAQAPRGSGTREPWGRGNPRDEKLARNVRQVDLNTKEVLNERATLSQSVTPELEEEIAGNRTGQKFLLKQVLSEIHRLETKKFAFPMPAVLEVAQWKILLSLLDARSRFAYLDMLGQEARGDQPSSTLEQIQAEDAAMNAPLVVPEEMLEEAVGADEEKRKRLKLFLMHTEMSRQEGEWVPARLTLTNVKDIATGKGTSSAFGSYTHFMFKKEQSKLAEFIKKRVSQARGKPIMSIKLKAKEEEKHLYYGLGGNVIHLRLNRTTENHFYNWKALQAFQHSSPLVIDFSYFSKMASKRHLKSLIFNEISNSYTWNRVARTPYALHFTNVTPDIEEMLFQVFQTDIMAPDFPALVTREDHLEMFDQDRLVYLSPDSRNDLERVSEDDVYVIGALINKTEADRGPLTLAKAKRLKIRHARFPIKRTLGIAAELNVDACVGVMCDMKESNDWFYSCRWVPGRLMAQRAQEGSQETAMRYQAHRNLMPSTGVSVEMKERNMGLTAHQYREMYTRLAQSKSYDELNAIMETHKF